MIFLTITALRVVGAKEERADVLYALYALAFQRYDELLQVGIGALTQRPCGLHHHALALARPPSVTN
jgi:hypothetical protein